MNDGVISSVNSEYSDDDDIDYVGSKRGRRYGNKGDEWK